jgi:hypothetical protein
MDQLALLILLCDVFDIFACLGIICLPSLSAGNADEQTPLVHIAVVQFLPHKYQQVDNQII